MTGLVDRFKKGTNKAAFEANRLIRIQRVESSIGDLRHAIRRESEQLAGEAIGLWRADPAALPEPLAVICARIGEVEQQIEELQAQIVSMRAEQVPEPEPAPVGATVVTAHAATAGHICPSCQVELPAGALFCPRCGGPAADVEPGAGAAAGRSCGHCGNPVPAEARFCPVCGQQI